MRYIGNLLLGPAHGYEKMGDRGGQPAVPTFLGANLALLGRLSMFSVLFACWCRVFVTYWDPNPFDAANRAPGRRRTARNGWRNLRCGSVSPRGYITSVTVWTQRKQVASKTGSLGLRIWDVVKATAATCSHPQRSYITKDEGCKGSCEY